MGQRNDLLGQFNGEIVCETPNNLLNKFEGSYILFKLVFVYCLQCKCGVYSNCVPLLSLYYH